MYNLSIIIPAYNESERISQTLKSFSTYLQIHYPKHEILVVDDGSTDNTVEIVQNIAKNIPEIRLIQQAENKGKGAAVKAGMLAACGRICVFSDADASTPITEINKLISPILNGSNKIVIGNRYHKDSQIDIPQPRYRRIWSRFANQFVQRILLPGIVDPNCGFKAFDRQTAVTLFQRSQINEWSFDLEILALARKMNFSIAEIPVVWNNDERTKGKLSHIPKEVQNLFRIKRLTQLSTQHY